MQQKESSIEVTGISQRQVVSDNVEWVIPIKRVQDNLCLAKSETEADISKILEFLKEHNIADSEIDRRNIRVRDNQTDPYFPSIQNAKRYVVEANIVVKSKNISPIMKASQNIEELITHNVVIAYDNYFNKGPKYYYSKFNEVDPIMQEEAVNQAKKAAEAFANSTGNKLGKIKEASVNVILISSINKEEVLWSNQGHPSGIEEDYGVNKKLRVIAKIKYYLGV